MKVRIKLLEEMLGTKSANIDLFTDFIASKCEDDSLRKQELETAEHREEAGTTVFHRNEAGFLILWDYQIKGFLKESGDINRILHASEGKSLGTKLEKPIKPRSTPWSNIRGKIDNFIFIRPRQISLGKTQPDKWCERSLRVMTMQGPRVSVAKSETVSAGTEFEFTILFDENSPITQKMITEILDYGIYKGLGQWRNSGRGTFEWSLID